MPYSPVGLSRILARTVVALLAAGAALLPAAASATAAPAVPATADALSTANAPATAATAPAGNAPATAATAPTATAPTGSAPATAAQTVQKAPLAHLAADCDGVGARLQGGQADTTFTITDTSTGAVLTERTVAAGRVDVVRPFAFEPPVAPSPSDPRPAGAPTRTIEVRVPGRTTPLAITAWPPASCATGTAKPGVDFSVQCGGINIVLWNDGTAPASVVISKRVGNGDWTPLTIAALPPGGTTSGSLAPTQGERTIGRLGIKVESALFGERQSSWTPALCGRGRPEKPVTPVPQPSAEVVPACGAITVVLRNTGTAGVVFTVDSDGDAASPATYQVDAGGTRTVVLRPPADRGRASYSASAPGLRTVVASWTPVRCGRPAMAAPPTSQPGPTRQGATPDEPTLPVTGGAVGRVVTAGGLILMLGAVLLVLARRRHGRSDAAV